MKIFEDHHGAVELLDGLPRADGGHGAQVLMKLPVRARSEPVDELAAQAPPTTGVHPDAR
jgi:hypothetical protein